jgi:cytochrome c nitrite reductase small subunit
MRLLPGENRAGVVFAVLFGILLGAGGWTAHYSEATSYLSNDPRACVNCHIMREQYDGWQKAGHHTAATCNDCHVPQGLARKYVSKAENGFWHSKGFTLQDFHEPIRIRPHNRQTVNSNCRRCHAALVDDIHPGGVDCIHCHLQVGHGPTR